MFFGFDTEEGLPGTYADGILGLSPKADDNGPSFVETLA